MVKEKGKTKCDDCGKFRRKVYFSNSLALCYHCYHKTLTTIYCRIGIKENGADRGNKVP